ncbi:hypothetical protein [Mesorhizobium sp. WSM2561]|uniref:hypothetical protein n=1 Tax=Mesorhizobium sp. WSM2561 TaxID=1040985 RepID=UPI0012EC457B|nr:hypothetical protein [Mesorhizobium sp. WSM2561]
MLEKLLPAEELKSWKIGNRAAAPIALIGEVVHCLEDGQPCHQPHRQEGPAGIVVSDRAEPVFLVKRQSIVRASFTSARSMSSIWLSRDRNRSVWPLSRRSLGHIARARPARQDNGIAREGRINLPEIVVHSHEIRQTRILVQIQNSHKSAACEFSTDDEEALALQKPVPPMMR